MQYKTELHAHSKEVSPCADLSVEELAERYIAAGYSTLVLTNHYCPRVIEGAGESWEERIEYYLAPYRKMKEYAKDRLQILLGCELRFTQNHNDYLVFGLTEEFLISHPNLHEMRLKDFSALARQSGLLLFWAHPFRNHMTMTDPKHLDGIEVFNAHTGHDSRNHLANAFADTYGLLKSSGSDFHHPHSVEAGGILTNEPITSMEQLVTYLREQSFDLICQGPAAVRDGMTTMPAKKAEP